MCNENSISCKASTLHEMEVMKCAIMGVLFIMFLVIIHIILAVPSVSATPNLSHWSRTFHRDKKLPVCYSWLNLSISLPNSFHSYPVILNKYIHSFLRIYKAVTLNLISTKKKKTTKL